jgi:hypothetical protein
LGLEATRKCHKSTSVFYLVVRFLDWLIFALCWKIECLSYDPITCFINVWSFAVLAVRFSENRGFNIFTYTLRNFK